MDYRVVSRGSPTAAAAVLSQVLGAVLGTSADRRGYARTVFLAMAIELLSCISLDFVRKATGATGEDGVTWAPLSKEYLAYQRRFGPGEKAELRRNAGVPRGGNYSPKPVKPEWGKELPMRAGLLTKAQTESWWAYYFDAKHRFLASGYGLEAAKRAGAQVAWSQIKAEGGKTFLSVFGERVVDILRNTGVLLNSLSPGVLEGDRYEKPSGPGGNFQIAEALKNGFIVGTNVAYAGYHQDGKGRRHRPFLPENIPQVWWDRMIAVGEEAIALCISDALTRGAA